ncbi:DUF3961 domain-containing protein [Bacillus thuringiensis]|nr:DUF3961 domain-containing protein [Bacillus thuringiensis]TKA07955.1 DUF3961 domain-containing protein [Bacillus thuringiensis]
MFAKLNHYFGLETLSDRVWYYGVFGVGGVLFLIDMAIAFIL